MKTGTCETCDHWKLCLGDTFKPCLFGKIIDASLVDMEDLTDDCAVIETTNGACGDLLTGCDFGCVHHTPRRVKK